MHVERCTVEPANHVSYVMGMGHAGWAGEEVVMPAIARFLRSHMRSAVADTEASAEGGDAASGNGEGAEPGLPTLTVEGIAGAAASVPVAAAQHSIDGGDDAAPACAPASASNATDDAASRPGPVAPGTAAAAAVTARPPLPRHRSASGARAAAPHTASPGSPDGGAGGGTPNLLAARRGSAPPGGCGSPPIPASVRRGSACSATSGTPPTPPPPAINAALANPHARMGTLAGLDLGQVLAVLAAEEEARRTMPGGGSGGGSSRDST